MLATAACIHNDIPYPRIQPNFTSFVVEDAQGEAVIDSISRTVSLTFPETADIANVRVSSYTISAGGHLAGDSLTCINLETPLRVVLSLYQDYDWTIKATQDIERYFTVEGQIGSSTIDVPGKRVVAYVSDKISLDHIKVERMKLGAEGSTTEPDLEGQYADFTSPVTVSVTTHGVTNKWRIYLQQTSASVSTVSVDAWTCVAYVHAEAETGHDNGIEYRPKGEEEWTRVPAEWLTSDGGSFTARLLHLTPMTTYEARAYSDDEIAQTLEFTTGAELQIPNSNFDQWWLDGKVWNPWAEGGEQYWDTGNKGATTLGDSNSAPTDDTPTGSGLAAKLETRFVGIGSLGKLASGNIFAGYYVRTDGTNGILSFGREFVQRPTKMRGYYKYKTSPISSTSTGFEELKDRPDTCIIWCALIDQATPFEIRTNPKNRQLFDSEGSYVVAYGKLEQGSDINSYIPFEIELKYKSTSRVPKYILITASASKYGDYFTGGNGSILYLDDLELVYDY